MRLLIQELTLLAFLKSAAGITTRSKAKLTPDQWTVVPLPAKVFIYLFFDKQKINLELRKL